MKFASQKDLPFTAVLVGVPIFLFVITTIGIIKGDMEPDEYWVIPLVLIISGFLFWFYFGTSYILTNKDLIYKSGPIHRKISISRIKEVVMGRTLWLGFRPATSRNGLIIKYDEFNEIYISPKTNESFIEKLLELKGDVAISE